MNRKNIIIAVIALICIACTSMLFLSWNMEAPKKQKGIENDVLKTADGYSAVYADEEFARIIAENPIDRDFVWDDTGSEGRIRQAIEYKELWEAEIAHTFELLRVFLSEQDFETLKQAYKSWKEYQEQTFQIEQSIYYVGSSYKDIDGVITGDNYTYPQVMETAADRTKRYAIELKSLEYTFYGRVDFCAENAAHAAAHETTLEETPKEADEVIGVSTSEFWHSNPIDRWRREMLEEYAEDDWHWEGPISYEYKKAWKDELEFQMWEYGRLGAEEKAEAYLEAVEREAEALMDLWDWEHDERDGGGGRGTGTAIYLNEEMAKVYKNALLTSPANNNTSFHYFDPEAASDRLQGWNY